MAAALALAVGLRAETGYDLWLRYAPWPIAAQRAAYRAVRDGDRGASRALPTSEVIAAELARGLRGLLGVDVPRVDRPRSDGAVIVGTPATSPLVAALGWTDGARAPRRRGLRHSLDERRRPRRDRDRVDGRGGRALRRVPLPSPDPDAASRSRVSTSPSGRGSSAGCSITGTISTAASSAATPAARCGGPTASTQRVRDYARANASIGINGTVINSVNANPQSLTAPLLEKSAAIARMLRPYGIRVYLAANFAAPKHARRPDDRRSARPGGRAVVAGEGRRDLHVSSPTSAASSSRPTARGSPGRRTTAARTPTARTCWPTRWRRTAAS